MSNTRNLGEIAEITASEVKAASEISALYTKTLDNPSPYSPSGGDQFGRSVAISGNYAVIGADLEDEAGGTSSGKAYIYEVNTGILLYTLDNPNAYSSPSDDNFGRAVAISGNYVIVGAENEDEIPGTSAAGKAYIYDISTFTSSTITSANYVLDNPNGSADALFGYSVSISGNYAIVGAYKADGATSPGTDSGKAYIYDISTFTTNEIASANYVLENPNAYNTPQFDYFGRAVSISGNYAIVGADFEDEAGGSSSGKVYIFDISTFTTSTITTANYTLVNPNAYGSPDNDYFGYSVSISGNYAVVGAYGEDEPSYLTSGKAYIYDISTFTTSTITTANYTLDNPNAYDTPQVDAFGRNCHISGNYVILGVFGEDDANGSNSGKAYLYDISTFTTTTITTPNYTFDNPNASADDYFGVSVGVSGNYVICGASRTDDAGGTESGKAYIFKMGGTHPYTYTPTEIASFAPPASLELISTINVGATFFVEITEGFSSKYDNYVLYLNNVKGGTTGTLQVQLFHGGSSTPTTSNYSFIINTGTGSWSSASGLAQFDVGDVTGTVEDNVRIEITGANAGVEETSFTSKSKKRTIIAGRNTSASGGVTGVKIFITGTLLNGGNISLYGVKT